MQRIELQTIECGECMSDKPKGASIEASAN